MSLVLTDGLRDAVEQVIMAGGPQGIGMQGQYFMQQYVAAGGTQTDFSSAWDEVSNIMLGSQGSQTGNVIDRGSGQASFVNYARTDRPSLYARAFGADATSLVGEAPATTSKLNKLALGLVAGCLAVVGIYAYKDSIITEYKVRTNKNPDLDSKLGRQALRGYYRSM